MKTRPLFFVALGALFSATGCVTSQGTDKSKLPADWLAALPKSDSPVADFAGVYVELGEMLDAGYTRNGTISPINLSKVLTPRMLEAGAVWRPGDRGATTELRRSDDAQVELITRIDDEITSRLRLEAEFEKETGARVLHHGRSTVHVAAAGHIGMTVRFWRAADGRLYARVTGNFVGQRLLVPTVSSSELWCRWDPATPEAVQKQADTLFAHDRARSEAAEVNRRRARVGAKAPTITGSDLLTGRPVNSVDYKGSVMLLHVWSTSTDARALKWLRAAYEKHHGRGLEIVGLCKNPANEREQVGAFIKAHDLIGPQLYDGKGTQGELLEAYFGTAPWSYCVIDRQGRIAAFAVGTNRLEAAIEKALGLP